jgi:Rab GDP dissociation inhibitor
MLNKPIEGFVYDSNGRVTGVKSEGEVAKCSAVIGDPSYFTDKVTRLLG